MIIFEKQELHEAFTKPVPYTWDSQTNNARFYVDGVQYNVSAIDVKDRDGRNNIEVSFQRQDTETGNFTHKLNNADASTAITVMSTVLAAVFDKAAIAHPYSIKFNAYDDEDRNSSIKRFRLYKRMAERYAKLMDYSLSISGRDFVLTNNNYSQNKPGIPKSNNIERDGKLTYVQFKSCNELSWATLFNVRKNGDFVNLTFPNGRVYIKMTDIIEIRVETKRATYDNLNSSDIWNELLGTAIVRRNGGNEYDWALKAAYTNTNDMVFCDHDVWYKLPSNDFKDMTGLEMVSIR